MYTQTSVLERTPTKITPRFTIGAHGSTAFHPITASCKIVPQGQATSLAESPGKSFQPITMSCKIVSGMVYFHIFFVALSAIVKNLDTPAMLCLPVSQHSVQLSLSSGLMCDQLQQTSILFSPLWLAIKHMDIQPGLCNTLTVG